MDAAWANTLSASAAYAAGWAYTARRLYAAWRPSIIPIECTRHKQCQDGVHNYRCYRRIRPDLSRVAIDTNAEAVTQAAFLALLWPFGVPVWLIKYRQPYLPAEVKALAARKEKERREEIASLERDLRIKD